MSEPKTFPTLAVLSACTGRLMCEIGGVYEVLNYMTGESLFTHQLPRVSREALPNLLRMHPSIAQAIVEAEQITPENYRKWCDEWLDRYGPEMAVPKFGANDHERIDPISELAEVIHPDRIVAIKS